MGIYCLNLHFSESTEMLAITHTIKYPIIIHVCTIIFLFYFAPCTVFIRDCTIIYFTVMISQNFAALDPYLCEENRVSKTLIFE